MPPLQCGSPRDYDTATKRLIARQMNQAPKRNIQAAVELATVSMHDPCRRTILSPQLCTSERPQLSGHFGLPLDGLEAVLQPVAGTVDGDDVALVEKPVEDRGGEDFVTEDLPPLIWGWHLFAINSFCCHLTVSAFWGPR
ncbi:hypothetical protein GA0115259_1006510 [Streptomyces sp. MnatMP-M17]|nr:hypothetical protein GA0115259_1006510 [Streptomyces sp. MnatMP-M17]